MAPPSSGGSTIGEALNILEGFDLAGEPRERALHRYLEASKLAYADRGAYLGDPEFFDVPLNGLLSEPFAAERRALIRRHGRCPRRSRPAIPSRRTPTRARRPTRRRRRPGRPRT